MQFRPHLSFMNQSHMSKSTRPGRFVISCVELSTEGVRQTRSLAPRCGVDVFVIGSNLELFDFVRSANFRGKLPQSNRDSPHHTPSFSAVSRPFTQSKTLSMCYRSADVSVVHPLRASFHVSIELHPCRLHFNKSTYSALRPAFKLTADRVFP